MCLIFIKWIDIIWINKWLIITEVANHLQHQCLRSREHHHIPASESLFDSYKIIQLLSKLTAQNLDHWSQNQDHFDITIKSTNTAVDLDSFDPFNHPVKFQLVIWKSYILIIELSLFSFLLSFKDLECLCILFIPKLHFLWNLNQKF